MRANEFLTKGKRQLAKKAMDKMVADESEENSKYLGPTEKVANISPVLGAKPKKQTKLMNKFFGSS